jgi:hypothetical protein
MAISYSPVQAETEQQQTKRAKREAAAARKAAEALRFRVCGVESADWLACLERSHAAVMARYTAEGRTDNKPRTLAAIRVQAKKDNGAAAAAECARLREAVEQCRREAVQGGRLLPGATANVADDACDRRHRAWVNGQDAGP